MQNIFYKTLLGAFAAVAIVSCKPDQKAPTPEAGSLDVSKYVSIGNSITSGYADNALYYDGQMVSYPNLIAQQFKLIGGGEFRQPLVNMSSVGIGGSLNSKLTLGYKKDCKGVTALSPVGGAGDFSIFTSNISSTGPFNNMGVPGAKSFHVPYPGYGMANPFFGRMTANPQTSSILAEASAQKATFFSLFIGNNDVLSYALAGGAADSVTNVAYFGGVIDLIVGTMMSNGAKGVIGNIPDVTNIPYFTTVPYNGLTLDATQAAGLSAAYAQLGIKFSEGSNAFIIADASAPGGMRQIKSNELILLSTPQDSLKCAGWGSTKPIANQYVLSTTEIANIQNGVAGFNAKLRAVADAKGLAYVDVNAFMAQAKKGITYNGVLTSATFVSGGAFSLDGVHLTPKGNALLANEFLKAINAKYSSTVPLLNVGDYKGVVFPN
ncbi:hypothetical protein CNR22_04530 [Sphingobacteriaceae bacterium]|nr:hypothetical protein CNR22_04530 [Sphingobacteriaceae bacterium]